MYFKGLKVSLLLNFAAFLTIGMLLVNFVVIALWRQNLVSDTIEQAKFYLDTVRDREARCEGKPYYSSKDEERSQTMNGDFVAYCDNRITFPHDTVQSNVEQLLRQSALSRTSGVHIVSRYWNIFGFSIQQILVAEPAEYCGEHGAIGIILNMRQHYHEIFQKQTFIFVYILVNVIILTSLVFFRLRKIVIKPLENLVQLSETYSLMDTDLLSISRSTNEFGHVSGALQKMFVRIEKDKKRLKKSISSLEEANRKILDNQKKQVEAEKFAAIGRLSSELAHEIGNPLGIIQGYLELLQQKDLSDEDREQYGNRAMKELARVDGLMHQLLNMARTPREGSGTCDFPSILQEVVIILRQQKNCSHISFDTEIKNGVGHVIITGNDLHQVLLNCLLNSIDAINEKGIVAGNIFVLCQPLSEEDDKMVKIVIEDNGSGIDEGDLEVVFEPFFTRKSSERGTGLGLSVSRSIVEKFGGIMSIESDGENGTSVTILLRGDEFRTIKQ